MIIEERRVLLPAWIFEQAGEDKKILKDLIVEYMRVRYPDYSIVRVKDGYAMCRIQV